MRATNFVLQNAARIVGDKALYDFCRFPKTPDDHLCRVSTRVLKESYTSFGTAVKTCRQSELPAMFPEIGNTGAVVLYRRECICATAVTCTEDADDPTPTVATVIVYANH